MKHLFVISQFICIGLLTYLGSVLAYDMVAILQIGALILGLWAIRSVGQNNWSVYPIPNPSSSLSTEGAYHYVRHPMYTALLLFFLPIALRGHNSVSWILYGILVITLLFKIGYEEKKLLAKHSEYADYQKKTRKRIIPFIW